MVGSISEPCHVLAVLREDLFDSFLDGAKIVIAGEAVFFLTIPEQNTGRDSLDPEVAGGVGSVVDVDGEHLEPPSILVSYSIDRWGESLAWLAPTGAEVHKHRDA